MCQFRLGKENDAKIAFDTIKNRTSETHELIILAGGYKFIGEWEVSIELTFKALENDPNDPKAHLAYIFAFLQREQADGKEPETKYIKAFQKSISEFNKRFPEEKALQGFEVQNSDVSKILEMVNQMAEVTDNATTLYKESQAPMAAVPMLTGKRSFDVWAAFTQMPEVGIKISFGASDEVREEAAILEEHQNRFAVVDIYPLFFLAHFDQLDQLLKVFKKIYIHQSVMDELTGTIEDRKISVRKGVSVIGKVNGKHQMSEIPPEHVQKTLTLLEKIRNFISSNSSIEVRGFAEEKSNEEENVINALEDSTRDSVLLAEELKVPLYCDDRVLRAVIKSENKIKSFSSQSLFNFTYKNKFITLDKKYELQKGMLDFHYDFVSIDAFFIFTQLINVGYIVEKIENIISVLISKETNVQSLGTVLADLFLIIIGEKSLLIQTKIDILKQILTKVSVNHDLNSIEENALFNLQTKIKPEKWNEVKEMIRSFFQGIN
jgi:predicted nucleic acid-binding protein